MLAVTLRRGDVRAVGSAPCRPLRRAVLLLALLLALAVASGRAWVPDEDDGAPDEEDEDEDEVAGAFDFFSDTLDLQPPPTDDVVEAACDAAGECSASLPTSVLKRGLVTTKPTVASILREHAGHSMDATAKRFTGETLGYVTPWNGRGYDFVRTYRSKLDYVAPVWLQVREDAQRQPIITGAHDVDAAWVRDVKYGPGRAGDDAVHTGPKMVPRVMYERNQLSDGDVPVIIDELLGLARVHDFDGFVFEIPVMPGTMDLLTRMGDAFLAADKLLLLVLPRANNEGELAVKDELFVELAPRVHRFTLNAYDFRVPGPNAPLPWLEATLELFSDVHREKILVGLPFYGYDNQDAITGPAYISALQEHDVRKIRWDAKAHECRHEYTDESVDATHVVFYPCLQFVYDRLELFAKHGVGVGVWELGQGLEYFFDLL